MTLLGALAVSYLAFLVLFVAVKVWGGLIRPWADNRLWECDERRELEEHASEFRLSRSGHRLVCEPLGEATVDAADVAFFEDWFALPSAPNPEWRS